MNVRLRVITVLAVVAVSAAVVGRVHSSPADRKITTPPAPRVTPAGTYSPAAGIGEAVLLAVQAQLSAEATTAWLAAIETAVTAFEAEVVATWRPPPPPPRVVVRGSAGGGVEDFLACTRAHESDTAGGYAAVSPSGRYRGAYQFDQSTWDGAVARAGYPNYVGVPPEQAPVSVQDAAARQLYAERGNQPWGGRC